jgi:hypothetical protein
MQIRFLPEADAELAEARVGMHFNALI